MSSLAARLVPGLLLACSLFFACENKAPAPNTATGGGTTNPPAASGDAIVIGHFGSLTGAQAQRHGVTME
jgi:hypothetical protein